MPDDRSTRSRIVVKVPHQKGCKLPVVWLGATLRLDAAGRWNARGMGWTWLRLICNDPACPAIVYVRRDEIEEPAEKAAREWMPVG